MLSYDDLQNLLWLVGKQLDAYQESKAAFDWSKNIENFQSLQLKLQEMRAEEGKRIWSV